MTEPVRLPVIGEGVILIDKIGKERDALVVSVFPGMGGEQVHGVNVVLVSDDSNETDTYGRQIDRAYSSVPHQRAQPAHGYAWKHRDDA